MTQAIVQGGVSNFHSNVEELANVAAQDKAASLAGIVRSLPAIGDVAGYYGRQLVVTGTNQAISKDELRGFSIADLEQLIKIAVSSKSPDTVTIITFATVWLDQCKRERIVAPDAQLDLHGVDFSGLTLDGINFKGANLANAKFVGASLHNVDLTDANLSNADLTEANLESSAHVNLEEGNYGTIVDSFMRSVGLLEPTREQKHTSLRKANFAGAKLTGANLKHVIATGANFTGADLTSADLAKANLTGVKFTGAILDGARLIGAVTIVKFRDVLTVFMRSYQGAISPFWFDKTGAKSIDNALVFVPKNKWRNIALTWVARILAVPSALLIIPGLTLSEIGNYLIAKRDGTAMRCETGPDGKVTFKALTGTEIKQAENDNEWKMLTHASSSDVAPVIESVTAAQTPTPVPVAATQTQQKADARPIATQTAEIQTTTTPPPPPP